MSYLGRSAKLSLKAQEKVSFLATAGQTSKTGLSYTPTFVEVYVNGVLLTDTTDFTATNGNSVTFTVALLLNDEVTVVSLKTFTVADHYNKTEADTLLAAKSPLASPSFTGNVGVGTSASNAKLEVVASSGEVFRADSAGGAYRLVVNQTGVIMNGNVGIGTSSFPANGTNLKVSDSTIARLVLEDSNASTFEIGSFGGVLNIYDATADAERMRIDAAGIVTKPNQPAFSAYPATYQSNMAVSTNVTIAFGSEKFDTNGNFDTSTSIFTAPVTGKYQMQVHLRLNGMDSDAGYFHLFMMTSNSPHYSIMSGGTMSGGDLNYQSLPPISVVVHMDANDTCYVQLYQAGGSATADVPSSSADCYFSGHLVG